MKNSTIIIIGIVGVAIAYYMLRKPTKKQLDKVSKPFKPSALGLQIEQQAGAEFNNQQNTQQSQEEESEFCGCGA
jgi:hypothetical protein